MKVVTAVTGWLFAISVMWYVVRKIANGDWVTRKIYEDVLEDKRRLEETTKLQGERLDTISARLDEMAKSSIVFEQFVRSLPQPRTGPRGGR